MFSYAAIVSSVLASEVNAVSSVAIRNAAIETLDLFDAIDALIASLENAEDAYSDAESTLVMHRVA